MAPPTCGNYLETKEKECQGGRKKIRRVWCLGKPKLTAFSEKEVVNYVSFEAM